MKLCKVCGTEYDNDAVYCNECDIDLDEDTSVGRTRALNKRTHFVLAVAKNNLIKCHQAMAGVQILLLTLILYKVVSNGVGLSDLVLIVGLSVFPIFHMLIVKGIKADKAWAHTASSLMGFLVLFGFPIGTIVGMIILINSFKKEWKLIELK